MQMRKKTLLFLCTGNTCRSPMAEDLFRMETNDSDEYLVNSAGLSTQNGLCASGNAILAMKELGRDISGHKSSVLDKKLVNESDIVLTMTEGHRQMAVALFPELREKIRLLDPHHNVEDPYGGDLNVYKRCRDQIRTAIRKLIPELGKIFN